jgi:hypothetical protein
LKLAGSSGEQPTLAPVCGQERGHRLGDELNDRHPAATFKAQAVPQLP